MKLEIDPCYLCRRFTVTGRNAPPAHGYCDGWEKFRRYDETNAACPLWNRARDEAKRKRWAGQQEQLKENV
jgi:hypothetical protein